MRVEPSETTCCPEVQPKRDSLALCSPALEGSTEALQAIDESVSRRPSKALPHARDSTVQEVTTTEDDVVLGPIVTLYMLAGGRKLRVHRDLGQYYSNDESLR